MTPGEMQVLLDQRRQQRKDVHLDLADAVLTALKSITPGRAVSDLTVADLLVAASGERTRFAIDAHWDTVGLREPRKPTDDIAVVQMPERIKGIDHVWEGAIG